MVGAKAQLDNFAQAAGPGALIVGGRLQQHIGYVAVPRPN